MRENLLYTGMGFILCFLLTPMANNLLSIITPIPSEIVRANDDTIELLGKTAQVQKYQAELLHRMRHYYQDHKSTNNSCPECVNRGFDGGEYSPYEKEPRTKGFNSLSDVLLDAQEIRESLDSIRVATIIQTQSLEIHLNHLRENPPPK